MIKGCCWACIKCSFFNCRLKKCRIKKSKNGRKFVTKTKILKYKFSWKVEDFTNVICMQDAKVSSDVLREDCQLHVEWRKKDDNFSIVVTNAIPIKIESLKVIGSNGLCIDLEVSQPICEKTIYETTCSVPFAADSLIPKYTKNVEVLIKISVLGTKN